MNTATQQTEDLKKLRSRIDWFCLNKVNAFSPTISPAPKSVERGEIESILEGVRFYVKNGVTDLVVQKKYMGSYCDIYLHRNMEETYFVSRNGHRIQHIDLKQAKAACSALHARMNWDGVERYIIQAELMPWGIMGKGLIDNEFEGYLHAHQQHYQALRQSDLYEKMARVKQSEAYVNFIADREALSSKDFRKKYPTHIVRQYSALEAFKVLNLDQYAHGLNIFEEQITHFGKEEALHFKPFNILKIIFEDGREQLPNSNLTYEQVSDDRMMRLKIDESEDLWEQVQPIYAWMEALTGQKEEGIMLKPVQAFIANVPPAFKVRNNHYLTMIYGVSFLQDLEENIRKRNVGRKIQCSVQDWMINRKLLEIPYAEIHSENYLLKNLVFDRIMGERMEGTLDSRL